MQPPISRVLGDFGHRLLELRSERGWTQAQAAERLGWAVRDFQKAEAGDRNLRISTVVAVSQAFDVPIADLFARPRRHEVRRPGRPPSERMAAEPAPRRKRPRSA